MERGDSLNGKIGYEPRRITSHVSGPKKTEQIMPLKVLWVFKNFYCPILSFKVLQSLNDEALTALWNPNRNAESIDFSK